MHAYTRIRAFTYTVIIQLTGDIKGLRVGLLKEGFDPSFETDVNELVKKSAERLSEKGVLVEQVSVPWHLDGKYIYLPLL